jgi:hypothetical protein
MNRAVRAVALTGLMTLGAGSVAHAAAPEVFHTATFSTSI